jgi:hypothetical protein
VWWWLGLLSLAALAGALGVSRRRRGTLRAWAVTTTVLTLVVLIALRVARALVVPQAKPENRDAVGAMFDVLAGSLRSWTLWLLGVVLLVLVLTLVWGRLGLVAGVRRGVASARTQLRARREQADVARTHAAGAPADGAAGRQADVPAADEPWTRRTAAWLRAFGDGLDLPERTARLGGVVRARRGPARWTGVAIGALILLFWPAPTLSVLIWIGALVALYLGALEWLVDHAPALPPAAAADGTLRAELVGPRGAGNGSPVTPAPAVPAPRSGTNGAPLATPVQPLVPAALTDEAITTLGGRLDLLVRLGAARDAGVLTAEEFDREKDRLLGV